VRFGHDIGLQARSTAVGVDIAYFTADIWEMSTLPKPAETGFVGESGSVRTDPDAPSKALPPGKK
jgi:hypothetical protein